MRRTNFGSVNVNQRFWYMEMWLTKIDPSVPKINTFFNAVDDSGAGFWMEDTDLVEVIDTIVSTS
jgi:hypothetical protein